MRWPASRAAPQEAGGTATGAGPARIGARGWLGIAFLCLTASAALVYPPITKYDLYDPGLGGRRGDVGLYVQIEQGVPLAHVARPWRYRVLTPLAARLVPPLPTALSRYFDIDADKLVKYHFGVVNMLGLAGAGMLLVAYCGLLGFGTLEALLAALLFFTSFPVVNFAGTPMVDAWAYAFLLMGLVAAMRGSVVGVLLTTLVGLFEKETLLLLAPAILLLPAARGRRLRLLLAMVPGVAAYLVFRLVLYPGGYGQPDDPVSSFAMLAEKLRHGPYWAFIAFDGVSAFGLLWPLAALGAWEVRGGSPLRGLAWLVPIVLVLPFLIGSNVGRIWFYAFPAVIPLALVGLRRLTSRGALPATP